MADQMKRAIRYCLVPAPSVLVGVSLLKCRKEVTKHGYHGGDHKVSRSMAGVGKITVTWKQDVPTVTPPPVIELDTSPASVLPGAIPVSRLRCRCPGPGYGANIHKPGCPLARG